MCWGHRRTHRICRLQQGLLCLVLTSCRWIGAPLRTKSAARQPEIVLMFCTIRLQRSIRNNGVDHIDHTNFAGLPVGDGRLTIASSQFQHAIAAADYGSFRPAAHALSIKQSTLSRSIQLLEHSIGVVIFERSSGGVRATPAASSLSAHDTLNTGTNRGTYSQPTAH